MSDTTDPKFPTDAYFSQLRSENSQLKADLAKWTEVFGHLGSADECGNEWIALSESKAELESKLAKCQENVTLLLDFIKNAPVSSGVCCCGDSIEAHHQYSDHYPVDQWDYSVAGLVEKIEGNPANIENPETPS